MMMLRAILLGPLSHWLLIVAIMAILALAGNTSLHVRHFVPFVLLLIVIATAAIAIVLRTCQPGQQVTREPIDIDEP